MFLFYVKYYPILIQSMPNIGFTSNAKLHLSYDVHLQQAVFDKDILIFLF